MYHSQQQVALTTLRGQHSSQYKEFFGDAVYTAPGQRTTSQIPREGIQRDDGTPHEDLVNALESLRSENSLLREQLAIAQDQIRPKQRLMRAKLKENLEVDGMTAGQGTLDLTPYEVENKLLKRQMEHIFKDAEAKERSIATLERYSKILEAQNTELISCTNTGTPKTTSQEGWNQQIPRYEKGSNLLNDVQGVPNTRQFTTVSGPAVSQSNFQENSEKLENKLNKVLESVELLTRRVASFQSNPPFDTTSAGGAALKKMNTSVDKMGEATDEVAKVASKLSMLENTIAKLANTNVLNTVVANSKQASTSIYQISDALQNMEGKFDLLVKNLVHKVENIASLINDQHQRGEGIVERVEVKVVDTPQVMTDITLFNGELNQLCDSISKINRKLERTCLSRRPMGLQLERCRGESYRSLLSSDVADLRKDLYTLRGNITRTTVTPISAAIEGLLDKIAAISTYMVELKLQAFERSHTMPMEISARNEGRNSTSIGELPEFSESDYVTVHGNSNERCRTM